MSVDDLWYRDTTGARAVRAAVAPLSWLYGGVVALRNALYDRHVLRAHPGPVPVISVGNVSVGGTGKTPFSAFIVRELTSAGHTPAVVMRGYGNDELHLHARMNAGVLVITGADRVAGIRKAAAAGADVVVLDDAFQHRRAARNLDVVLVSAEGWHDDLRLLPAGPLREPLRSLGRADLIVVTRKIATNERAVAVAQAIGAAHASAKVAIAALEPDALILARGGDSAAVGELRGARVLAVAGVGDPNSFFAQLRQLGADVTALRFRDHHDYTDRDARRIVAEARGHKYVVTTEKDAVKLTNLWPANATELWYLSQAVRLTEGHSLVASALANLFKRATSIAE
jgi:tetraacyldisaccharide 4'-kinase